MPQLPKRWPAREAGALDQPGGGELDAAVRLAESWGIAASAARSAISASCFRRDARIDEERAAAPAVLVARVDHHRFGGANREHALPHVVEPGPCDVARRQVAFELGVGDLGFPARFQAKTHGKHDVATRFAALEQAVAVAEAAGLWSKARRCPPRRSSARTLTIVSLTSWPYAPTF